MVDVLARLPGPLMTGSDTPSPITVLGGGSAANTAAWLGVDGTPVTLVGRTGDDAHGRGQRVQLIASGVTLALGIDTVRPTGTCIVLVDVNGERTMIPDAGANAGLTAAHLPTERFVAGDHLHVSGYALFGRARPAALRAFELAREVGMTISVGAGSSAPLRNAGAETFLGWLGPEVLLFANRSEAAVLTGHDDPLVAARKLAARIGRVVVTCGPAGAVWCDGGEPVEFATSPADVVDSTGAGDAFAAGAIAALLTGASPLDAMARGHALAMRACATVGGRPPIGRAPAASPTG
jgi:sugar/nucleoside kinase (ribokinase family)